MLLTGRVAVVTGAAQGIGRAIAEAYTAFGATVAACDRDGEQLATVDVEVREVLDVRDEAAVAAFVARLDGVDVLVNNAGGTFKSPFSEVSSRAQQALVDENFSSVTHFVRACAPKMREGGSIINITSIEAHRAGPGFAVYAAMKAAVANLTKSLALELGERRIRVNCIAPDDIPTPGVGPLAVKTPLPNQGHVDDVAGAAVFLASDLSRFVTGTTIHVDGGNWAAAGWRRLPDGTFTP
ncbi:MAG: 3-oxoacyl-[acyl-carrier protein] reductase [Actinomycetota bacterium]|nr:3-oxoacyl-[acyl-carrier protein] reductase [Actinomycetota bacterium]